MAVTFETFQQLYYVKTFNIAPKATFVDLFKSQFYQWLIWFFLATPLLLYFSNRKKHAPSLGDLLKIAGLILGLVILNVLVISTVQLLRSSVPFNFGSLWKEFLPFFLFQKAPIFILGYIAVSIIFYFYFANRALFVEVQKLWELKEINLNLYNELKSEINDKTTILNIKIGNKRKIVSVDTIVWIEADDYCVKVHLDNGHSYTMRSSLKKLEEKLDNYFLRVHRKAIVNMHFAKELNTAQSPLLILTNGFKIPVSQRNLKILRQYIS